MFTARQSVCTCELHSINQTRPGSPYSNRLLPIWPCNAIPTAMATCMLRYDTSLRPAATFLLDSLLYTRHCSSLAVAVGEVRWTGGCGVGASTPRHFLWYWYGASRMLRRREANHCCTHMFSPVRPCCLAQFIVPGHHPTTVQFKPLLSNKHKQCVDRVARGSSAENKSYDPSFRTILGRWFTCHPTCRQPCSFPQPAHQACAGHGDAAWTTERGSGTAPCAPRAQGTVAAPGARAQGSHDP